MWSRLGWNLFFLGCVLFVTVPVFVNSEDAKNGENLLKAPGFVFFLCFSAVVTLIIVYRTYQYNKSQKMWQSGIFDTKQQFTPDSLLESYIRLGGLMLRKDQDDLKGKMAYLHRYFNQHFSESALDLMNALKGSYQHPVKLETIGPWLHRHLRSLSERSQLLYFLAGLSTVDGSMNPKEKQFLLQLSDLLHITRKDFDSIMAMYSKYEDAYYDQFKKRAPSKSRMQYKLEKAAGILGVSLHASVDEIKKAYRALAKIHHPDRFATKSESQQKIAKERFVKIQLAYEELMNSKG